MSRILSADEINLVVARILDGTADPTAGGGVARAIGSLYSRAQAGSVALYQKTTAANTGWQLLHQSLGWKSVKDYGAVGDGVTDDTAAIQQAITDVSAAGGGVVYFPSGTYAVTQLTLSATSAVQCVGAGASSVIKWVWNAAAAAGSMVTVTQGAHDTVFSLLRFDGSGLTNPAAGRTNHLLLITGGVGGVTQTHVTECTFGNMVAGSGDGVHVVGTAGNLISRIWIRDNEFDGCSHFSVGFEQGFQYAWIIDNHLTNCETEIGLVATAAVNGDSVQLARNELVHTSATVRHALRVEGDPVGLYTKCLVRQNIVVGGFVTLSGMQYTNVSTNQIFSGAFASADPVVRVFGGFSDSLVSGNIVDRDPGASAGTCLTFESAGGVAPTRFGCSWNNCLQETPTSGGIKVVDGSSFRVGNNTIRATNAGATAVDGIDIQAVATVLDNALLVSNQITAAAGTFRSAVRILANGANIGAVSVCAHQGNQIDVGLRFEVGGGGGNFTTSTIMMGANNLAATTSDYANVGGAGVVPRIAGNACSTAGVQFFEGSGTPEGVVVARAGSVYLNTAGGQATTLYYKETGTGNVGWIAVGGSGIAFGTNDTTAGAGPTYLGPGFITTSSATEIKLQVTRPGTIRNLRVQIATAGTTAQNVTYTVRKNGVDTAITASISNTSSGSTTDLTHSITVAAGDQLSISVTKAGAVATGQSGVVASLELV